MKVIYLDCFSGISGNMMLGAFISLGVPAQHLLTELDKLQLADEYHIHIDKVVKKGISAIYVNVETAHDKGHHRGHHQHQHTHAHRHLHDIINNIDQSNLSPTVKTAANAVFTRLAEAEAKVHGTAVEKVHFHEVGAVDAIVDIVGTAICLDYLGITAIYTSKLYTGSGFVHCDHGVIPVPAPATVELLQGIPYINGPIERELVTPTGAAIIAALGSGYGSMPDNFVSRSIGYGAGTWDLDIPNVLRMQLGEIVDKTSCKNETIIVETNIDDQNGEVYGYVMAKLLDIGVMDVWFTPIFMKKNRPAVLLSIIAQNSQLDQISSLLFTETSTIGLRYYSVNRIVTERNIVAIMTEWGECRLKVSSHNGSLCSLSPEYEDCKNIALNNNIPLKLVYQTVLNNAADYPISTNREG